MFDEPVQVQQDTLPGKSQRPGRLIDQFPVGTVSPAQLLKQQITAGWVKKEGQFLVKDGFKGFPTPLPSIIAQTNMGLGVKRPAGIVRKQPLSGRDEQGRTTVMRSRAGGPL